MIKNREVERLPEPIVFDHLSLFHCGLTEIPKNIMVKGMYNLSNNKITIIPKGFIQNGYFNISYNKILKWPKNYNTNNFSLLKHGQHSKSVL